MPHRVTAIIPAYNEALRLPAVLAAVQAATLIDEIVVVDDGSTDETYAVAQAAGVRAIRLPENRGKGSALRSGAVAATGDLLLFLDADLRGLTPAQVDSLVRPVRDHQADMSIGVFTGGRTSTDLAQVITPNLSGQRCLCREFFLTAPMIDGSRSGVEIALTTHARVCKLAITVVTLHGATHAMKEEKLGPVRGALARSRMYLDIFTTLARYYCTVRHPRRTPVVNE